MRHVLLLFSMITNFQNLHKKIKKKNITAGTRNGTVDFMSSVQITGWAYLLLLLFIAVHHGKWNAELNEARKMLA